MEESNQAIATAEKVREFILNRHLLKPKYATAGKITKGGEKVFLFKRLNLGGSNLNA